MVATLEVRLLGPLSVDVQGRSVALGRGNEGVLVALLALNAGRPVPTDRIIDVVWPEEPPPSAREMVRIYVARARQRLGDEALTRHSGGYALNVEPDAVDAVKFERLCEEAGRRLADDPAAAIEVLDLALALWEGAPLGGLSDLPFVLEERRRLERLHLVASETRAEARLALGGAAELVPELQSLAARHPYSERVSGQLMLALYRAGRQTEALEHYRDLRRLLVEEVGVEPGPEVQELHKAILGHAASLRTTAPAAERPFEPERQHRRRHVPLALAAVAAAAVLSLVLAETLDKGSALVIRGRSIGLFDSRTGKVEAASYLGGLPRPLTRTSGAIWVGNGNSRSLNEVDARTLEVVKRVRLPSFPYRLTTGFGAIWVASGYDGTVVRVPTSAGRVLRFRPEPRSRGRVQIVAAYGSLWSASQDGLLIRVDPRSLDPIGRARRVRAPEALAAGAQSLWVADATADRVFRIDAGRGKITRAIPIGGIAEELAFGQGSLWALTPREGRLWRIDPRTNSVRASIGVGPDPTALAVTSDGVWIGSADATVSEIDTKRNLVGETIAVGRPVIALAAESHRIWVTVR